MTLGAEVRTTSGLSIVGSVGGTRDGSWLGHSETVTGISDGIEL